MNRKNPTTPIQDAASQDALRDESNKPEPLYEKTDRNFQQADQSGIDSRHNGSTSAQGNIKGSTSGEERDII